MQVQTQKTVFGIGLAIVTGVVALVAACATEPRRRPVALDPSNPAAAEAPVPDVAALSQPAAPPAEAPRPDAATGTPPGITLYTCPMHPEVISDQPGRCPKCGMNLVPQENPKEAK